MHNNMRQQRRSFYVLAALAIVGLICRWFYRRYFSPRGRRLGTATADEGVTPKQKSIAGTKAPQKLKAFVRSAQSSDPSLSELEAVTLFPRRYELHDHVVVVKLNQGPSQLEAFRRVAMIFAASFKPQHVDVVVVDTEGIAGELRKPLHEIVYKADGTAPEDFASSRRLLNRVVAKRYKGRTQQGDRISDDEIDSLTAMCASPTFTLHVENGVKYCFDVLKVMFCSGNTTERMHFGEVDAKGEVVVDMFAGIGYFTLPLALHGGVQKIVALEKNPDSCGFLRFNALLAGVGDRIEIHQGDNRVATGDTYVGTCDRVLMGYIPTCQHFLRRAHSFLKAPAGRAHGVIHYHFLGGTKQEAYTTAHTHLIAELGEDAAGTFSIAALRQVKSYAPHLWHYVADFEFA